MKKLLTLLALSAALGANAQTPQYVPLLMKDNMAGGVDYFMDIVTSGNKMFISSKGTGTSNHNLYISDGTPVGTTLLKDIQGGLNPEEMTAVNNKLVFRGDIYPAIGFWKFLWISDGTPSGTQRVVIQGDYDEVENLTSFNGKVYFTCEAPSGRRALYSCDGTVAGTIKIAEITNQAAYAIQPFSFTVLGNKMYFLVYDNANLTYEMWETDGTGPGTHVANIGLPANTSAAPVFVLNNLLFFQKAQSPNSELWATDGTPGGTQFVATLLEGTIAANTAIANGKLFFSQTYGISSQTHYWATDGTPAGTVKLHSAGANIEDRLVAYKNKVYFTGFTASEGHEVWASDGTTQGTAIFKDLNPGYMGGAHPSLVPDNKLFFMGSHPMSYNNIYFTDGDPANITMVHKPNGGINVRGELYLYNDSLYYEGGPDVNNSGLMRLSWQIVTGVDDIKKSNHNFLYPNPNTGSFTLKLDDKTLLKHIEVLNVTGQVVYTQAVKGTQQATTITLPPTISDGIYILRAATDKGILQQRLIIQH